MIDYNNSVIYIITIGNKKYVGSSANYKQRCNTYERQFNTIINNLRDMIELSNNFYDWNTIRKIYNIDINDLLFEEFIKNHVWKIEEDHKYSCNNNIELRCEEERTRKRVGETAIIININACVNNKQLEEDNERIRRNKSHVIDKIITTYKKNVYADYRKYKERNGEEINFYDYNYLWCKKYGKYKIIINDGIHYELWGVNKTHFKELTA